MSDQIVVLKNTKKGLVVDTVYNQNDSLFLDIRNNTSIEIPNDRLEVNTYPPAKEGLEVFALIAAIIGGLAAIIGSIIAFYKLFKKDEDKQEQLNKLTGLVGALEAQNELIKEGNDNMRNYLIEISKDSSNGISEKMIKLEEQRLRLITKPAIWTNGGGYSGFNKSVTISIDNRGEICYLDSVEPILSEGLDKISFNAWGSEIPIEKNSSTRIHGTLGDTSRHPKKFIFKRFSERWEKANVFEVRKTLLLSVGN